MASKTVVPVLETAPEKIENAGATFVNNIPDSLSELDAALYDGFVMQSEFANETDFRQEHLVRAVVAANKVIARGIVSTYDRAVDGMAKLSVYRKTHTRDAVEKIFTETREGKLLGEQKKIAVEYLEAHK